MDTKTRRANTNPNLHDYEAITPYWNLPEAFQQGDNITIEDLNAILASLAWLRQEMVDRTVDPVANVDTVEEKPKAKSKK